ncbi:MAG: hypothetical protein KBD01_04195 [Acidobacteria bacterium]|nr:hypothetical protein [Acidobacteriota bacterium]
MRRLRPRRPAPPARAPRRGQGGFLLVGLFTILVVGGILSGIGVQEWSIIEKREREAQLIFVQEQWAAAIVNYQKDQGGLPAELEQLTKKGQKGQVFIRKAYTDPMFRKSKLEDWCLLKIGQSNMVVSSCSEADEDRGQLGLGTAGSFQIGEEAPTATSRRTPGVAPGGVGIVGVHSKSSDRAYNIVKREEENYNRWYYTFEDYQKEQSARNIPGLQQGKRPVGIGPGGQEESPFDQRSPFSQRQQQRQQPNRRR